MEASPAVGGPHPSPARVLDVARLEELCHDLGDPSVVRQVVLGFLNQLDERVETIELAGVQGHAVEARRAAHTLKSSAALVGATVLAEASSAVEQQVGPPAAVREAAGPAARELRRWVGAQILRS